MSINPLITTNLTLGLLVVTPVGVEKLFLISPRLRAEAFAATSK
jgi:hypothetical protein